MKYQEYGSDIGTYVLFHTEGTGEQGGSGIHEREMMGHSNDYQEMLALGNSIHPYITGWDWDRYTININTSTEKGKELWGEQKKESAAVAKWFDENPDKVETFKIGDNTISVRKNSALSDSNSVGESTPYMAFLMPSGGLTRADGSYIVPHPSWVCGEEGEGFPLESPSDARAYSGQKGFALEIDEFTQINQPTMQGTYPK